MKNLLSLIAASALFFLPAAADTPPDFGDDSSPFANDGECDDPRFEGPGMTLTRLLSSDRMADATDCQAAWEAGQVTLREEDDQGAPVGSLICLFSNNAVEGCRATRPLPSTNLGGALMPDFGTDTSTWANDGECDDPRFEGPGMTSTPLMDEDRFADATDCRTAWMAGQLSLKSESRPDLPDFGTDTSTWANDGECDDPRFEGPGMTSTPLMDEDRFADATDCRTAWMAGQLSLKSESRPDLPDFGTDTSTWANDGECDDPRFEGPGMTSTPLMDEDRFADATDCRTAWMAGQLSLSGN